MWGVFFHYIKYGNTINLLSIAVLEIVVTYQMIEHNCLTVLIHVGTLKARLTLT